MSVLTPAQIRHLEQRLLPGDEPQRRRRSAGRPAVGNVAEEDFGPPRVYTPWTPGEAPLRHIPFRPRI